MALLSPFAVLALEKTVSKAKLEDLLKSEGSYLIPLEAITKVETAKKWGGAFLRVDHPALGKTPVHSYIFGGGFGVNKDFMEALNSAISSKLQAPSIPPPAVESKNNEFCTQCGQDIPEDAKFCPKCGATQE